MMDIPAFLAGQLASQYDEADVRRILSGYGVQRRTTLRVNRLRTNADAVRAALAEAGIGAEPVAWSEDALVLAAGQEEALAGLAVYSRGEIYVQSLSSMIPPLVLDAKPGENVLDMAAAPGGKTTQIAALTENRAMITACERNKARAERLRFNVERQGASHVTVMNADARQLSDLFAFDRVLLDAPCSGSGTVAQGFRGRFEAAYLARTVQLQTSLLHKAIRLLKPGHEMVYSTCSILRQENEQVIESALRTGQVELLPIDDAAFEGVPRLPVTLAGTLCVCPDERYEGFFVARLKKRARR